MKSAEVVAITQPEQEIERQEERRYQAMLDNDLVTLERLLGEELRYVHSNALVDSKASYIASLKSNAVQYQQIVRENVLIKVYSETSVVTGRILMTAIVRGEVRYIDNVFVNIWAKQKQGWQLIHFQSTPISR